MPKKRLAFVEEVQQVQSQVAPLLTTTAPAVGNLQTQVSTLQAQLTTALASLTTLQGNYTTLQTSYNSLTSQVSGLPTSTNLTALQSQLTTLQGTVSGQGTTLSSLQTTIGSQGTSISSLTSTVSGNSSSITSLQSTQTTQAGTLTSLSSTVGSHTSTLTQHTTDIGNRLRKDQADSTPFNLGVAKSQSMTQAVRKEELVGGLQQPYRFFLDVQNNPVQAFSRNGERVDIGDDNNTGQVLVLTLVSITNTGSAALATTIGVTAKRVSDNGVVFTQSIPVVLASIPAIGKTVDLLQLLSTPPTTIPLTSPIYFEVTASTGKYEVRIEGKKR